jgi:voltage-gated potassium channel
MGGRGVKLGKRGHSRSLIRQKLHEIIFEADTPLGKLFDIGLIVCILFSVVVVMLDSIQAYQEKYGALFLVLEWVFTVLFTIEYILRLYSVDKPLRYARSFFGIVDLLAILPTYLSLFLPGTQFLVVIRTLRTMRVWRILKLGHYITEIIQLKTALRASIRKVTVFLFAVMAMVVILGSLMYIVEGGKNGFTSIPRSVYWAIVTLTTVGYGDISPKTNVGQFLAALAMILGYAIIAVPTGIVSVEMANVARAPVSTQACPSCSLDGHAVDASFCKYCGASL